MADMNKLMLGSKSALYPYPINLLGTLIDGKPNFMTLGFAGVVNINPSMVAIGCGRSHATYHGIKEN